MQGLSLVVASGDHSSSRCTGLSLSRPLLLRSTGSRRPGSVVVAHEPSCSAVCGIFPDQGSNACPLHWQADSQPLCHQGSPVVIFYFRSLLMSHSCLTTHGHLIPDPSTAQSYFHLSPKSRSIAEGICTSSLSLLVCHFSQRVCPALIRNHFFQASS